jgi:hypothetical protein
MIIERKWAMPNKHTFLIKPIDDFIKSHLPDQPALILDPFANRPSDYGAITNDLNPNTRVQFHMCALDFLRQYDDNSVDMVLFDPPYSPRQLKECYDNIGQSLHDAKSSVWSNWKKEISRITKPGGIVLSFGWNTVGIGMSRGFDLTDILMVSHGGMHNDTLCTKEVKK